MFESWKKGRSLSFVRNPYYRDRPKPCLDKALVEPIPNAQQLLSALIRGELDWMLPRALDLGEIEPQFDIAFNEYPNWAEAWLREDAR